MRKFLNAFVFAAQGIYAAIRTQRNLRIHFVVAVTVTAFSFFYSLSKAEYVLLILTFGSVIVSEMFNTAVEAVVDICSPQYSKIAKFAKDTAAGAVFVSAVLAVVIGFILFGDSDIIRNIISFYLENFVALLGLIVFVAVALLFIIYPKKQEFERE